MAVPGSGPLSDRSPAAAGQPTHTTGARLKWWSRRGLAWFAVVVVLAMGGLEVVLRLGFGLGDPPLYITDPTVEYMMKPGAYRRFGNRVTINRWSMRGGEVAEKKTDPRELRVLVIGDSVVNGGSPTDDADLATALLPARLDRAPQGAPRPVTVCNISAGSWGPSNQLAYLRKFGTFDADVAVIVVNSIDYGDEPTFAPLNADMPTSRPFLAIQEALANYLPRLLGSVTAQPYNDENPPAEIGERSLASLRAMVELLRERGVTVIAVHHPRKSELAKGFLPGHDRLTGTFAAMGVQVVSTAPHFRPPSSDAAAAGANPYYRDDIHPNADGQRILADVLELAVRRAVSGKS